MIARCEGFFPPQARAKDMLSRCTTRPFSTSRLRMRPDVSTEIKRRRHDYGGKRDGALTAVEKGKTGEKKRTRKR